MIEEPEEEKLTLQLENYISSEESTMIGEGEFLNIEALRIGGGIRGGGQGRGRGENSEEHNSVGFPIVDEDTNATMKNISPSILLSHSKILITWSIVSWNDRFYDMV